MRMKLITIFSNIAFIIFILSLSTSEVGRWNGREVAIFAVFILLPIVNLLTLCRSSEVRSLIALYMEKKRLEQEIKIEELRKSSGKKA
jgi:hypothetical protein